MHIAIVTMFPEFFTSPLGVGVVGRAVETGLVEVDLVDLREHGLGRHRQLDDTPFGGGPGMVMMIEPLAAALDRDPPGAVDSCRCSGDPGDIGPVGRHGGTRPGVWTL